VSDSLYTPLIAGIDTLEIGYCIVRYELSQEEWEMLQEAKERAQSTLYDKGTGVRFRGYDLMVLRTGSGRYKFILSNEDLDIRIFVDARSGEHFPELKVRFKSQLLWRHGWQFAVRKVDEWIRTWTYVIEVKISRIDITVDFMGKLPILSPELREVVARPRKRREFGTYERYSDGNKPSGYRFGENDLSCRMYDKTKEVNISGKKWFERLWTKKGWIKGEVVTRVEFQCRRKIIRSMQMRTIEELFLKVPDLWKYLTSEWLTIRIIHNDSHRTRWPITDFWQVVQSACSCFGQVIGVSRLKQMRASKDILERNLRGYVFSLAALAMKSLPGSDVAYGKRYMVYFLESVIEDFNFEQEVQKRRHKYDSMEY
jgi:hypothetical protein